MADVIAKPASRKTQITGLGAVTLALGGLAAGFSVAACCALPLLFATLGLGTAWLTGIAWATAPYRLVLLLVGAAGLAGSALLLWRAQRHAACTSQAICSRPAVRGLTLVCLALGSTLLYLGYIYV